MTQYEKIINLLKEKGSEGINSYDRWSIAYQLPARIFYLRKSPWNLNIEARREKDGSVQYILHDKQKPVKRTTWLFTKDGKAIEVDVDSINPEIHITRPKFKQASLF